MFDIEDLRNEQLIDERIEYENDFISIDEIRKSEEVNYYASQYEIYFDADYLTESQYGEFEKIDLEFDFEDYMERMHDEKLIDMMVPDNDIIDIEMSEYDPLEAAIESLNEPQYDIDYCDVYEDCYFEEIPMDAAYSCGELHGYAVSDSDFCDYDYPEGPDENLQGVMFAEPCCFEHYVIEIPEDFCGFPQPDNDIPEDFGKNLVDTQEKYMEKLICERIKEENEFNQFVKEYELSDEYFMPDGIILC